jgi:hypothetical protein
MTDFLEARGGRRGGAGTNTGEQVIVRLAGGVLDVFTETTSQRFHAAMVDTIELTARPNPVGEALTVTARRTGCQIPVRFEGDQRRALERIIKAVRAAR